LLKRGSIDGKNGDKVSSKWTGLSSVEEIRQQREKAW
jgi:hypothetical protein